MAISFLNKGSEIKGQQKTVTPSTSQQVILPDEGYNALTSVTVNAVDNTIDSNIQASNIKKDISILGVTGTLEAALQIAPTNTFTDATAKQFYDIQAAYDEMQPRVLTDNDKTINKKIYCIPAKSDGTPLLDTSKVTSMGMMFVRCTNLKSIPQLDTSNVTDMNNTFWGCSSLETIPLLNTSKVTNMSQMFQSCTNLKSIPQLDTSNVTDMGFMFWGCSSLETIPLLNTSKVTNMSRLFQSCSNLKSIPQLDTSKVTDMYDMFYNCISLSNESLNNILAMCANATTFSGTKTLQYLGLKKEQATTCTTLSNWEACEAAGWTTGY